MKVTTDDIRFMRRALRLARNGEGNASPNPMVGAVIVRDGKIIGEGWHRRWGEGHAEVNAVASVADKSLLADSTIYVTLEPCSHYGKTPPCARLLIDMKIPRVVVGSLDPFEKVSGRGVAMLREAGAEVIVGVLEQECKALNRKFMTAHLQRRPFITLKWAQSSDGFIDRRRSVADGAARLSTPLSLTDVHRERSCHDAILVGAGTVIADSPSLTLRYWSGGRQPRRVILDGRGEVPVDSPLLADTSTICYTLSPRPGIAATQVEIDPHDLNQVASRLYHNGITSLLVEGGRRVLDSFINAGLWDTARIEVAPVVFGSDGSTVAPAIPRGDISVTAIGDNSIITVDNLRKTDG